MIKYKELSASWFSRMIAEDTGIPELRTVSEFGCTLDERVTPRKTSKFRERKSFTLLREEVTKRSANFSQDG
jgi:chemotaxis methyl-accepting protein methylase